jgi:hypothetical protein
LLSGKVVIVDYAQPRWWNPLRYLWRPVLALLEPLRSISGVMMLRRGCRRSAAGWCRNGYLAASIKW